MATNTSLSGEAKRILREAAKKKNNLKYRDKSAHIRLRHDVLERLENKKTTLNMGYSDVIDFLIDSYEKNEELPCKNSTECVAAKEHNKSGPRGHCAGREEGHH